MGERIGRIGRIRTDFFRTMHGFQTKIKKNPSLSAQSAQSVLPLYRLCSTEQIFSNNRFHYFQKKMKIHKQKTAFWRLLAISN
jgi:hypothetical protein